ncbi:hypothetical protein CLOM_g11543 [Closterium sp. NIES-68]|nr:hypothetical protein CLOM_g11543 [Closterium sp. NIES-68]
MVGRCRCRAGTGNDVEPKAGYPLHDEQHQSFVAMWQRIGVEPAAPLVRLGVEQQGGGRTGGRSAEEKGESEMEGNEEEEEEEEEEEGERGLFVCLPGADSPRSPSAGRSASPSASSSPPYAPSAPPIPPGTPLLSVPLHATLWVPLHATSAGGGSGSPVQRLAIALLKAVCGAGEEARREIEEERGREGGGERDGVGGRGIVETPAGGGKQEAGQAGQAGQAGRIWRQYAEELLPNEIETLADWSEEDLEHLQSPAAAAEVRAYAAEMAGMAAAVAAAVAGAGEERARWALRVITSRSFSIADAAHVGGDPGRGALTGVETRGGGEEGQGVRNGPAAGGRTTSGRDAGAEPAGQLPCAFQVLVPLVDMANHACSAATDSHAAVQPSATWRISRGRMQALQTPPRFELLASRPLRPGTQVTISYGPLTSLAFLLSFGFLPLRNPANRVPVYSNLEHMLDDVEERVTRLRHKRHLLFLMANEEAPLFAYTGGLAVRLMECVLVLHAASEDEIAHLDHHWTTSHSLAAANVSPRTRSMAAKQLVDRCKALLDDYPTTLEDDEALLVQLKRAGTASAFVRGGDESPFSGNEQEEKRQRRLVTAVEYRMEEKRILADAIARYGRMV